MANIFIGEKEKNKSDDDSVDLLSDDDEFVDDETEDDESESENFAIEKIKKPKGKQKRRKRRRMSDEDLEKRKLNTVMEYSDWIDQFDWNIPGYKCKISRMEPAFYEGSNVSGFIEEKLNSPYTEQEIAERFGGGKYQVALCGPPQKPGDSPISRRKHVYISGSPKISGTLKDDRIRKPDKGQGSSKAEVESAKGLVSILGDQLKVLQAKAFEPSSNNNTNEVLNVIERVNEQRALAREESAREQIRIAEERMKEQKEETIKLAQRFEDEKKAMKDEIHRISESGSNVLSSILPILSNSQSQQMQSAMQNFLERERRIESQHEKQLDNINILHQTQLKEQRIAFDNQMAALKLSYEGQANLHNQQIQLLNHQIMQKDTELKTLRDEISRLYQERMTNQDPVSNLQRMNELADIVRNISGTDNSSSSDDDVLDGAPWVAKLVNNLGKQFGPMVQHVIEQKQGQNAQQQMIQQRLMQQQMMQQRNLQQNPQQQTKQLKQENSGSDVKKNENIVQFDKSDLEEALNYLNSIFASGTPAKNAAQSVAGVVDNSMLRQLCIRDQNMVVNELRANGLLVGSIGSSDGEEYLKEFLISLREFVS